MLNNIHLMPQWLPVLDETIDKFASYEGIHSSFRLFLSSDPSSSIPISLLARCIKITNDPPSGIKANLNQAVCSFSKDEFDEMDPRCRGILFGLCHFHALMVERKKFGSTGYNMMYPFSLGDLICSVNVLNNYMENAPVKVPWEDLTYLFGEIMYGGHIVNQFDRIVCMTYLEYFMGDDLLDEMNLLPYPDSSKSSDSSGGGGSGKSLEFRAPSTSSPYEKVVEHIEMELQSDSPRFLGLHPNAEIGFKTDYSEMLFKTLMEIASTGTSASSSSSSSGGGGDDDSQEATPQNVAETVLQDILESVRDQKLDVEMIYNSVDEMGPFQNVAAQECERMNGLLFEMNRSLNELQMGFRGDVMMNDQMEALQHALFLDRVPASWEKSAYPSQRALSSWIVDLQNRITQLQDWSSSPMDFPVVTWLGGLFNPQAFLTSVMQTTAQAQGLELDKLTIYTEVTKKMDVAEISAPSRDGAYISGMYLEGARWNVQNGLLESPKPREMFSLLPVVNCKPGIISDKPYGSGTGSSYSCPVFQTTQRGPTYVFSAGLKTKYPPGKWVLGGVALIMDVFN